MTFRIIEGTHWWALRTKAHFEKTVVDQLEGRHLEAFLPTYRTFSRRKDRRKIISLPLFPGYVFLHADLTDHDRRVSVLQTRGTVQIIGGPDGPVPVHTREIDSIRVLCGSDRLLEPLARVEVGKPVRIVAGGLAGVVGVVAEVKGKGRRIICNVNLLGRAVAAELRPEDLEPVGPYDPIE
jgi:transcription antitermination factor NusG